MWSVRLYNSWLSSGSTPNIIAELLEALLRQGCIQPTAGHVLARLGSADQLFQLTPRWNEPDRTVTSNLEFARLCL